MGCASLDRIQKSESGPLAGQIQQDLRSMMENYTHLPVMPEEVAQLLATDKDGLYVDATLGMGGHTLKLLSVLGEKARVIGVDWDPEMAAIAAQNTEPFAKQVRIIHG